MEKSGLLVSKWPDTKADGTFKHFRFLLLKALIILCASFKSHPGLCNQREGVVSRK
jgi:hypothetical protein